MSSEITHNKDYWKGRWQKFNNLNELETDSKPYELEVTQWKFSWVSPIDKFWENPDIWTWTVPEDVWEWWGVYNFTAAWWVVYSISSSDVLDTTQTIKITAYTEDSNGNRNEEIISISLNWQNKVAVNPASWDDIVRVIRMENESNEWGDLDWMVYLYEDDTVTWWVPDTPAKIRALINNWNNQTLMAIYTIPTWKVWFLWRWEAWISKSWWVQAEARMSYRSRRFWKVFKIKKKIAASTSWSSNYLDKRSFPDIIPAKTDIVLRVDEVSATIWCFWTLDILLVDEDQFSDAYLTAIWQIKRVT